MAQEAITKTQFQEKLKLLLAKDDSDCKLLVDVYNDVKTCAENSPLVKDLVLQHDPDFFKHVEQGVTDLKEVDRPILVIGETSAGKSSFLNLLIGRTVLPELAAPCTHCMCCIKKGTELEARVSSFDGFTSSEPQIISANVRLSDEEFQDKVQELVNGDNCQEALDRCIDIFVPSSVLEGNVYLVDTPGFGENEQLTKSLVKYLPKAIGIIFILNVTVSLGIADDRGVLIMDEIKRLREEGKIPSFDPTKVLFIANKWDQVAEKERKDHRLKIIKKMKAVWPNFQEGQLLPLSVTCVLELRGTDSIPPKKYKSATEDYQTVLNKIHETVEHCGNARSQVHRRFMFNMLKHMKTFVDATVTDALLSAEEKKAKVKCLQGLVNDMESTYNRERNEILEFIDDLKKQVVKTFHQYLINVDNRKHIFPWTQSNIPKGNLYILVKVKAQATIRDFIIKAFTEHIVMYQQTIRALAAKMSSLEVYKIQEKIENLLKGEPKDATPCQDESLGIELHWGAVTAMLLTSPIWVSLGLVGLIPHLRFSEFLLTVKEQLKARKYRANPIEYLDRWSEKIINKEFSEIFLKHILHKKLSIGDLFKEMDQINKSIKDLKYVCNHIMDTNVVPEGFHKIRDLCHRMKKKLNTIEQS